MQIKTFTAARVATRTFWVGLRPDSRKAFEIIGTIGLMLVVMAESSWFLTEGQQLLLFVMVPLYFMPTLSAMGREHKTVGGIFVVNLFLGWTFIGWVVALSWAMSKPKQLDDAVIDRVWITPVSPGRVSPDTGPGRRDETGRVVVFIAGSLVIILLVALAFAH